MQIGHFLSMCDDTGLLQHAVHSVPDRSHGYCVDDNARALLVACALNDQGEQRLPEAADGAAGRLRPACLEPGHPALPQFHELRSPLAGRPWARRTATDARCGRWANARAATPARRAGAGPPALFAEALPARGALSVRRAPGRSRCSGWTPTAPPSRRIRAAQRRCGVCSPTGCMAMLAPVRDAGLGLVRGGTGLRQRPAAAGADRHRPWRPARRAYVAAGLRSLRWLMTHADARTRACSGRSAPTASATRAQPPRAFDQQPLEATATISACLAAWRADGESRVAGGRRARLRMVPRRQRPVGAAGRSRNRQLPRRAASRPRQREPRRRSRSSPIC